MRRCCYSPEGHWFVSRWSSFNFLLPNGVDSASNRNKYQKYFPRAKVGRCVGLTNLPPSCANCLDIWEPQPSGTLSFRPHYGPGVDSASNKNEYQEYFLGGKGGRCVGLTNLPPSCANCLDIWEPQPSRTLSFRPHYGPGVDSASNRNEYQEYFLGVKAAGA